MNKHTRKQSKNRPIQRYSQICSVVILGILLLSSCIERGRGIVSIDELPEDIRAEILGTTASVFVYSIVAQTAQKKSITDSITIGGDIQARRAVSITPDTGGTLSRILVYEGEYVKKNQVIAFVDPSKAGKSFKESPVRTPISGIVSSLPTKEGNSISAQQIIATVADNSEIELKIAIPEKYVGKITRDTKGSLKVIAFPDVSFPMKVKTLSTILSSSTHTMPVTMAFLKQDRRLKSGMYGDLRLILEEKQDTFIVQHNTVIIRLINNVALKGVYLVKDGEGGRKQVYFTEVELGIENDNNMIELVSGVKEGDIIVTQGQDALSDGNDVEIFTLDGETLISIEDKIKQINNTKNPKKSKKQGQGPRPKSRR